MKSGFAGRGAIEVSRFKGLGEMPMRDLRDTTMDPAKRTLLRVAVVGGGQAATAEAVERLMGSKARGALRLHPGARAEGRRTHRHCELIGCGRRRVEILALSRRDPSGNGGADALLSAGAGSVRLLRTVGRAIDGSGV